MSEVIGKIIVLGDTQVVGTAGTFKKRTVVIETSEQYAQKIAIDFVQDKCEMLDKYLLGHNVKVGINIRGNEYNGKYYVSLQGWKIDFLDQSNADNLKPEKQTVTAPKQVVQDDLPF
jgi:ABC-type oligopeptide transport system substrate-binding subunit